MKLEDSSIMSHEPILDFRGFGLGICSIVYIILMVVIYEEVGGRRLNSESFKVLIGRKKKCRNFGAFE